MSFSLTKDQILKEVIKSGKDPVYFFESTIVDALKNSRKSLGEYINCPADDLVFFQNPTTAVNAVAKSLILNSGDEVLSTNHIYGALDRSWKYVCEHKNANFIKAKIPFTIQSKQEFLDIFFNMVICDKSLSKQKTL